MPALLGKAAPKIQRSTMETVILTLDQVNSWEVPPFQRPVRINPKVEAIAEEMKTEGTSIRGTITLGKLTNDRAYYIVDGQHRREAFRLSGLQEVISDIRVVHFDTMAEMAEEFIQLNTAIVRMRPDDMLRGVVPSLPYLQSLMDECPYIGFTSVRRGGGAGAVVSLAQVVRCWFSSSNETPDNSGRGHSITSMATNITENSARELTRFMNLAHAAWGRDSEYYRLWGALNMGLCMWLYRRMVLDTDRRGGKRVSVLTDAQFKSCLMALSANSDYLDWLQGRLLNDRDRSPAMGRIKAVFARRLGDNTDIKPMLPQPAWSSR